MLHLMVWRSVFILQKTRKRGKAHIIPVARLQDKRLCAAFWLSEVIKDRGPNEKLFATDNGTPFSYNYFKKTLCRWCRQAGIKKNIATHLLRRGGTTYMASAGAHLEHIKERGDWKSQSVFEYIKEPIRVRAARDIALAKEICYYVVPSVWRFVTCAKPVSLLVIPLQSR